jgi:hypothetical protein
MSDRELPKPSFRPSPDLVKLIGQLMEGVTAGRITSIACVTVSPVGQMQWPGCGMQIAEMMIGAELMRDDMKAAMRGNTSSKILRAG